MTIYVKLATARRAVQDVAKSKTADTGKYTYQYASLGDVLKAADAAFEQAGLQWAQTIEFFPEAGCWQLITTLIDMEHGETLRCPGPVIQVKGNPQETGSALTYFRRYSLVTLLGMNVEDDDGGVAARAVTQPGQRTEAEKQVREIVKSLPDSMAREDFQAEFINAMGSSLTNLPEYRHGDALAWAKVWQTKFAARVAQEVEG